MKTCAPLSLLTHQRPDIWHRGVATASRITGFRYPHKPEVLWGFDATSTQADGSPFDPGESVVLVPEGAMEWLLHEIGHWLVASPERRLLHDYGLSKMGHDADAEETAAIAVEEIVLSPYGPARALVPPSARDARAFQNGGPLPADALRVAERALVNTDVDELRSIWGEWVRWGLGLGAKAPWRATE